MKIQCRYTAVKIIVPGFQNERPQLEILGAHPLIDAPLSALASLIPAYFEGRMNDIEARIFFIAWLKSSGLVDFETAAIPSSKTIAYNMQFLIQTVNWTSEKENRVQFQLPRYVVRRANNKIANIRNWLNEWNEIRFNWRSRQDQAIERTAFLLREEALVKLLRSVYKNVDNYRGKLAKWALEASEAPAIRHEYWTLLIKLKEPELYSASLNDLEELLHHMEYSLDPLSTPGGAILKLLRTMVLKHRRGITYDLELFDEEEIAEIEGEERADSSKQLSSRGGHIYTILSSTQKLEIEASRGAPVNEPVMEAYRTRTEYIVARAKWNIAQKMREEVAAKKAAIPTEELLLERNKEEEAIAAIDPDAEINEAEDYDVQRMLEDAAFRQQRTADIGSFSSNPSGKEEEI